MLGLTGADEQITNVMVEVINGTRLLYLASDESAVALDFGTGTSNSGIDGDCHVPGYDFSDAEGRRGRNAKSFTAGSNISVIPNGARDLLLTLVAPDTAQQIPRCARDDKAILLSPSLRTPW
jgi:hypothetical protein